jgi:acyl-coenzyme A synthetase/AMP-(fatty) acid ligase
MSRSFAHPFTYLSDAVARNPDGVAISTIGTDLTYTEVFDSAVRIARVLREMGVRPGDVVGVAAQPIIDLVVAEALFHEACVGAEVPPGMANLGDDVFDWLIVVELRDDFAPDRQILLDTEFVARVAQTPPTLDPISYPGEDSACRLNFSSGTTGVSKAIPVSVRCLEDRSIDRRLQWMLDEPYLCLLGLSTGLTFMTFIAQVKAADTFILATTGTTAGEDALTQVRRFGVRCIMGSPHQLGTLLSAAQRSTDSLDSVTTIMSAGSVMPDFIVEQLQRRFTNARFVSTYASSEAGSVALRDGIGSSDGFAGTLLDDVEVIIVDDNGNPVPDGETGNIAIKRAHQPQEYLNDPVTTALTFRDGYFFPGDTGYLRGRELYLSGRSSELINAAGVKADPARIESVVFGFGGITDAAVFPLETNEGLIKIALVFVADADPDVTALLAYLRDQLGESSPSHVARVPHISRNHMGKVNRSQLAQTFTPNVTLDLSL